MARTRPGIDRITKQGLQAAHALAVRQLHAHLKLCGTCTRAKDNLYMRCGTWWDIAKTERRTARQLRSYLRAETDGMTPMLTAEQCDPPPF